MKTSDNPCYKCELRIPGCHATCDKYSEWKSVYQEYKNKIREQKISAMKKYPSSAINKKKNKLTGEV